MDAINKTLEKIEKMEGIWKYILSEEEDKVHSFGRVPEDWREVGFWSVPRATWEFLKFMVKLTGSKKILELWCSVWYSTIYLARGILKSKGHVYTTEILQEKIKISKENFKEAGLEDKITLIEDDIRNTLENESITSDLDFIFMDADKERYVEYLDLLVPKMKKWTLIIVDNAWKVRMADWRLIDSEHIKVFKEKVEKDGRISSVFLNFDNGLLLISKI